MKKFFITFCILVCIVTMAALLVFNTPIHISKTCQATEFNLEDKLHIIPRQVSLCGDYHANLFVADTFSGMITISDYDYTNGQYEMDDVEIAFKSVDLADNNISYDNPNSDDARDDYLFAEIYTSIFRNKFAFVLFEDGGYSTEDATFIVTGIDNRNKAVKWIEEIFFG